MAPVPPHAPLRRNEDMIGAPVEGGYVLLDVERGKYLHFNATAMRIWEMLETPKTVAELCAAMQERFDEIEWRADAKALPRYCAGAAAPLRASASALSRLRSRAISV